MGGNIKETKRGEEPPEETKSLNKTKKCFTHSSTTASLGFRLRTLQGTAR